MKKSKILLAAIILIISFYSNSQTNNKIVLSGIGSESDSCAKFIEYRINGRNDKKTTVGEIITIQWAQGYLGGINSFANKRYSVPSNSTIGAYLETECNKDPVTRVYSHIMALALRLQSELD